MYQEFFGLAELPFTTSPDPRMIFFTNQHREALAKAQYAIENKMGLCTIFGPIGSGKTSLARLLYHNLKEADNYEISMIVSPDFTTKAALLRGIMAEFQAPPKRSHDKNLRFFQDFVTGKYGEGKTLVLLLDEAQTLGDDQLETLRHVLNFETDTEKFIQIVLFGQNELGANLDAKPSLKSRITMFGALSSLSPSETAEMIKFRWKVAGGGRMPFTPETIGAIYKYSRGLPREICKLCNEVLTLAFVDSKKKVTPDLIDRSAINLRIKDQEPLEEDIKKRRRRKTKEVKK